jgi:hypothetical protein
MRLVLPILVALASTWPAGPRSRACCLQDIRSGAPFTLSGVVRGYLHRGGVLAQDAHGTIRAARCLGPPQYWRDLGFERPAVGEPVTVVGYEIQCEPDSAVTNAASRVIVGGRTLELRDPESGFPLW